MKKVFVGIGLLALCLLLYLMFGLTGSSKVKSLTPDTRARLSVLPLPLKAKADGQSLDLRGGLLPSYTRATSEEIAALSSAFLADVGELTGMNMDGGMYPLIIHCIDSGPKYPAVKEDESYQLKITADEIVISCANRFGLDHALQTVLQLIVKQEDKYVLPVVEIEDEPRFPWRGIMIDVSRHWIPKRIILENIDLMNKVKFNVLHLHLTDNQGFRIESKTYPKLHEAGSNGNYFTHEDIRQIVDYAALRGIRVIPEFSLPGHCSSWLVGYPTLGSRQATYEIKRTYGFNEDVMDVTREETYVFLDKFFEEMTGLFPDPYIHLGGDEVVPTNWLTNPAIVNRMNDLGFTTPTELQAYFNLRMRRILDKHKKFVMGWDEILHPQLAQSNVVIQSWRSKSTLFEAARLNQPAVLSSGWYLDHKLHASQLYEIDPLINPNVISIEPDTNTWQIWNIAMDVNGAEQPGKLFLFGDKENTRGAIRMMQRTSVFEKATWEDNAMSFEFESGFGNIRARMQMGDQILDGNMKVSLVSIDISGEKVGANNMDGESLPAFRKSENLTTDQEKFILGGEACQWSEVVDSLTINSRIWPNAAAVAERLWSPSVHCENEEDMYRRLSLFNNRWAANSYMEGRNLIYEHLSKGNNKDVLAAFVDHLEVVKYYDRLALLPELTSDDPLFYVADVAQPESMESRDLTNLFSTHMEGKIDVRDDIIDELDQLIPLYSTLSEQMRTDEDLQKVEFLCLALSDLAKIAKTLMSGGSLTDVEMQYYTTLKSEAIKPRDGVLLAAASPLIKLIDFHLQVS